MGNLIDKDNWRHRVLNKALVKAGLRKIRIHSLRHTYATLRIAKGDNLHDVPKQLGQHSVKLTPDVYSHWIPGKKKAKVDALDDIDYLHPNAPYPKFGQKIGQPEPATPCWFLVAGARFELATFGL